MSSIAKVIELIAESDKSWEDAVHNALAEASQTVQGITEIWVSGQKAIVEDGKIVRYRANTKVTFLVRGHGVAKSER